MGKLKKWINEHKSEMVGFGVFLILFVVLTGGVVYYSFAEPPKDTKAATGQETSVAVKGQKEKAENEEQDKNKKETDIAKDKEKIVETSKKDTADKENEERKSEEKKSVEEKKDEQEKKQETAQKTEENKATETAAAPAASTETSTATEQSADTGSSAPADTAQPESSNTQATQSDPEPVQETPVETPVQEAPTQETPVQETPAQPEQEQPATPEPEPEPQPVWHEPVYEQQWVVDQAAWDETVSEPIYENVELCICNGCGADITSDPWGHLENQMLAGNMACSGYHSEWQQVQTGTNTYTVHHDEVGHYENVLVQEGYWE